MATDFTQEDQYVGKQIILDSDRLVFNGRENTIISSKNHFINKTNGETHFNSGKNIYINGPQLYIGPTVNGQDPNIPAVRSTELKQLLRDLIGALEMFFQVSYPNTSGLMGPNPGVNLSLAQTILSNLAKIKTRLDDIDSKNIFIS